MNFNKLIWRANSGLCHLDATKHIRFNLLKFIIGKVHGADKSAPTALLYTLFFLEWLIVEDFGRTLK